MTSVCFVLSLNTIIKSGRFICVGEVVIEIIVTVIVDIMENNIVKGKRV